MAELIDGAKITMGGREWIVPALSFKQVRTLLPEMQKVRVGAIDVDNLDVMARVVHAALARNYPDVSFDDVEEMLDLRNGPKAFMALMGQSGLEESGSGEAETGSR